MSTEVTHTKTKYKVLTDRVYASPVDEYEVRMRRVIGWAVLLGVLALLLAVGLLL